MTEILLEVFTNNALVNFADKNVVATELGNVGTEELIGERKGTAGLASDIEVSEGTGNFTKLGLIIDLNDGLVEGLVEVAAHLRNTIKIVTSLFLDDISELDRGVVLTGKVINVEQVLSLGHTGLHCHFLFLGVEVNFFLFFGFRVFFGVFCIIL